MPPLDQLIQSADQFRFKLDLSGAVGLFGGDSAVDALGTIHLYAGRRWAGWYNYPGTVTVARRFGQMADSRFWDSLFPGPNESPAVTFNLSGKSGPRYSGSISGTKLTETNYLGYLIAQECAKRHGKDLELIDKFNREGRKTGSSAVTVISLPSRKHEFIHIDSGRGPPLALWAIFPSLVSILACVFCIVGRDLLTAFLILLGIISSGITSLTLGTATLKIRAPVPSAASPPGDGLLLPANGSIIVLKGQEADVNVITKGEFVLDYSNGILPCEKNHMIGVSCLLLMIQSLTQLLLIPHSTFFGQVLFLLSFFASGIYHLYVASHEREKAHRDLLLQELSPHIDKRILGTRTQMAVFVCLVLGDDHQDKSYKPEDVLKSIIPNDTAVWRYWRRKVLNELAVFWKWEPESSWTYEPSIQSEPEDEKESVEYADILDGEKELLEVLICDAWCIFNRYPKWREESKVDGDQGAHSEEKAYLLPPLSFANV